MNKLVKAALPYGIVRLVQNYQQKKKEQLPVEIKKVLAQNIRFKGIHKGERCFIVGTGPSIKEQNLLPLKDEIVFSLSRFYHHEHYTTIKPKYQVFSGLTLHPFLFEKPGLPQEIYGEAEEKMISENIFTYIGDKKLVEENNFFKNQTINYFEAKKHLNKDIDDKIDLTTSIYGFHLIPELAIQIAIYMGFKDIFLLGLDHTWIIEVLNNRKFEHQFYNLKEGILGKNNNREHIEKAQDEFNFERLIKLYHTIFNNYTAYKNYCQINEMNIYNATKGGLLNIFDRVQFDTLF